MMALLMLGRVLAEEGPPPDLEVPERVSALVVPTLDHTPETGLALGAVALISLRPSPDARTSTVKIEATGTWRRQAILETGWELFLPEDRWLLAGNAAVMRYPEQYWGVGPDTPDDPETYDAWRIEGEADLLWRPWRALYVGPSYLYQWMFNLTPAPGGRLDRGDAPGADGGLSSGLGYAIAWDDRTSTAQPTGGSHLLRVHQARYAPAFGSDHTFSRTTVDGRWYLSTWRDQVLALQGLAVLHTGEPPFRMLAMLGGDTIGRGYYYGRYRDRHLLAAQAEYRAPIVWRVGVVAFAGLAEVTPRLDALTVDWLRPTLGGGLRVRVTEEAEPVNLRLDYAVGRESAAFYFGFGEVF